MHYCTTLMCILTCLVVLSEQQFNHTIKSCILHSKLFISIYLWTLYLSLLYHWNKVVDKHICNPLGDIISPGILWKSLKTEKVCLEVSKGDPEPCEFLKFSFLLPYVFNYNKIIEKKYCFIFSVVIITGTQNYM